MSRARLVCSEILSKMSPIHQFDEKVFPNLNSSQEKNFNLCLSECSNGEVYVENTDVLSEMNTTMDDWLRQKTSCTSMDCIDTAYLNDENFLSTKDPDMCSPDIGLELVLVNEKKESNLNYCSLNEKNSDLDCTDPMLNLVPMNEVLLRKTETKCDNLLSGKDLYVSDGDININKSRSMWDTLSIASRKSDCDVENNGDFADFNNLLSFSFDTNDHISSLETIGENIVKNNSLSNTKNLLCEKLDTNSVPSEISVSNKILLNDSVCTKSPSSPTTTNKKSAAVKRPNILRTTKPKLPESENDTVTVTQNIQNKNVDKNMNVDMLNSFNNSDNDSVFNFSNNESEFIILPEEINCPLTISVPINSTISNSSTLREEEKKVMKKHHISEINNMTGAVATVSNSIVNSKLKTKIIIKTGKGDEKYEGNTAELTETVGTTRKNRRPGTPVEGEHVVTSVKTAATIKEEKKQNGCKIQQEPEDRLVRDMLNVLGITDEMLYTILTNLGLRMWVCPEHECRRIFNRLNTLKSHILSHYGLKPFKCDFPGCPWSFYTSFKLKRHRETHLKRKDFMCTVPDCNRTFTTIYNLNTHLKLHERPAGLKCLVRTCNFKFQTRRAMEMHLKTHEISSAPYKCPHPGCNKLYFSCSALTAHSRCHQHKEEELRCQWENCGRLFDKPCRLKAHMRQHTGDKPYVCKYKDCKWAFSSASKLKRHQYKHNNERKFRCTIGDCTKAFMRSEHLREHTYTHIAQRTFQCTICGEKCSAKATLYVHKKKFHPNEDSKTNHKKAVEVETQSISNLVINDCNENKSESAHLPENISSESSESENTTFIIALVPSDKPINQDQSTNNKPVLIQNVTGKEYEVNLENVTPINQLHSITNPKTEPKVIRKTKVKSNSTNKSCARTYLPYLDASKKTDKPASSEDKISSTLTSAVVLENHLPIESPVTNITLPSDLLLGSELLQNNHETVYLSNLMLQDDVGTMDLYNSEDGAEYILLLDSGTNTNFPESTINLKDLD